MHAAFLAVVLGGPLAICIVAVIGAHFHDRDNDTLLGLGPSTPPDAEHVRTARELEDMLGAVNRYRRRRGASERSLDEIIE